jgi:hypothetical protein
MSAISAIAGSIVMALMVQGPANLQLSEIAKVPPPNVIPKGTVFLIQLTAKLSTKTLKEGDGVYGITAHPITVNNEIVVPVGSWVSGKITQVQRPGKVKGKAGLALSFQTLILTSGSTIPLYASLKGSSEATTPAKATRRRVQRGDDAITVAEDGCCTCCDRRACEWTERSTRWSGAGAAVDWQTVLLTPGKDIVLTAARLWKSFSIVLSSRRSK